MKMYVSAMAESKKEVERNMYFHTKIIVEHIIKAALMPEHSARNHWKKEIASQLYTISKLKTSKQFPNQRQIYYWSYKKEQDLLQDSAWMSKMYNHLVKEYNSIPNITADEFVYRADTVCDNYFRWISEVLSKDGFVEFDQIYGTLDSLLRSVE